MERTKEVEAFALLVVSKIKEKGDAIYTERKNVRDRIEKVDKISRSAGHDMAALIVLAELEKWK